MQNELKTIAVRAVRIAVAIVIAGASLWLALSGVRARLVSSSSPQPVLRAQAGRVERQVTIHANRGQLRAEQQIRIQNGPEVCEAVRRSALERALPGKPQPHFWFLGLITIDGVGSPFEGPEMTASEGGRNCTVTASLANATLFRNEPFGVAPSDEVVFQMFELAADDLVVVFEATDVQVRGMEKAAYGEQGSGRAFHWAREKGKMPRAVSFRVTAAAGGPARIVDVITRIDEQWASHLSPAISAILLALPYALFVVAGRRHATPERRRLLEMGEWLLALCLFLQLTYFVVLFYSWLKIGPSSGQNGGEKFGSIFSAFAGVVFPLLVLRWWRKGTHSWIAEAGPRVPKSALIGMALGAVAIGTAVYGAWAAPNHWWYARQEALLALALAAFAAACYWLMRETGGGIAHAAVLALAAAALFLAREQYARPIALVLCAFFLTAMMLLARTAFTPRRLSRGTLLLFLGIAALTAHLLLPAAFYIPFWEIQGLAHALNATEMLALLAAFLLLLRDHSAAGASSGTAVDLGFAFALAIIFNHRYGAYGAVDVGSAYLLLRYWLFVPAAVRAQRMQADPAKIREGVSKLISLREAERAMDGRRSAMRAKVIDGSATWDEYQKSTAELESVIASYNNDAVTIEASQRALAYGPLEEPWKRGVDAARLAAVMAIPWCIVYAAIFETDALPLGPQWWLDVIATFVFGLIQWPLFAFFFGYFYPDVKGRSGLSKALVFFVTVVTPPLLAFLLFTAQRPSTIFALWILQNFIQSMVLGLVCGDYRTLRHYGLGWRNLRDVHNLGVLAAYGSTVIVAIGAAISTALAGAVADALLKLMPR